VITPYRDVGGALVADMPVAGVCAAAGDPCRVVRHHRRGRKTGPQHPLMVARCTVHGRAFTLYPPGHVPYGRWAIAPVASEGSVVRAAEGSVPVERWRKTLFEASLDAAEGTPWTRFVDGGVERWWGGSDRWRSTQGVLIGRAEKLVGIAPELAAGPRERIAEALDVPMLVLRDAVLGVAGYVARGTAVVSILERLAGGCADGMATCGELSGLWGQAHRWDGHHLRTLPFRPTGTGPVPRGG
jgi:hypothetical protein